METTLKQTAIAVLASFALFYGGATAIRAQLLPLPQAELGQLA